MFCNKFKDKKLSETSFEELAEHRSGKALSNLLTEGEKGLRSTIFQAMYMAADAETYRPEEAKKKKKR